MSGQQMCFCGKSFLSVEKRCPWRKGLGLGLQLRRGGEEHGQLRHTLIVVMIRAVEGPRVIHGEVMICMERMASWWADVSSRWGAKGLRFRQKTKGMTSSSNSNPPPPLHSVVQGSVRG